MDLEITSWVRRISNLKSEALWVFIGQLGMALGVVLGVKILTQVLDPAEFGRMALANTVVLLVGSNIFGPIGQGFMRFWSICQDRDQNHEFFLITDRFAGRLLFFTVGLSLILFFISATTEWPRWIVLMTLSLIAGGVTGYFGLRLSVFLAARNRKIVALVNTGVAILKPVIALFFVIALFNNADCVILGYVITAFLAALMVERLYKKTFRPVSSDPSVGRQKGTGTDAVAGLGKEILAFSWPFCIWGIVGWVHQSCDRWSLQAFHGTDVVGAFSVISVLAAYPLIFGANLLSNLFVPIAYQRAGNLDCPGSVQSANGMLYLMTGLYIIWAVGIVFCFAFFHYKIVLLTSNLKYVTFSALLPGLASAWALFYLGQVFSGFGLLAKRPKQYIFPIIVSAFVAAVSTFFLSKHYGPEGVVWGLGISGFVYAAWFMGIGIRLTRGTNRSCHRQGQNNELRTGNF
jgi:O-antigen/teichoic acid export membrane protein